MAKHVYFVAFTTATGSGNCEMRTSHRIDSMADIQAIGETIAVGVGQPVQVTNYQLLRVED